MKLKLLIAFCVFFITFHAQTNSDLKGLINKNNIAIRSVQKNLMANNNTEYFSTFKLLLQHQQSAVKAFKTTGPESAYFALLVRKECLDFLKKNSNKSLSYFEITKNEKTLPSAKNDQQILSIEELKTIENIDPLNPQHLNNLILTVQ